MKWISRREALQQASDSQQESLALLGTLDRVLDAWNDFVKALCRDGLTPETIGRVRGTMIDAAADVAAVRNRSRE